MLKIALVIGGGKDAWAEVEQAKLLASGKPLTIIACNHAARDYQGFVHHSVTMHPDLRERFWIPQRRAAGLPDAGQLWHPRHRGAVANSTPIESQGGSSGMLCVTVARHLGFNRIMLAGVPMTKLDGHYDDPKPWTEARQYHNVWNRLAPALQGTVKSFSGFTRELLGAPSEEWLNADPNRTP